MSTPTESAFPRPAATICLFRAGTRDVLMVQRGATARFMASAWVFPGGSVEEIDHHPDHLAIVGVEDLDEGPWVAAALRELVEEVGIWLGRDPVVERRDDWIGAAVYAAAASSERSMGGESLGLFANWITPRGFPMRFDTRFYAATVPRRLDPDPDPRELDRAMWIDVDEALRAGRSGAMIIPFPTRKTLEYVSAFPHGDALVDHAVALADVMAVLPKVRVGADGSMGIVLPTEPGYQELEHLAPQDSEQLSRLAESARHGGRGVAGEA